MASSERFGFEWNKYDFLLPIYEEQFLAWIAPLGKEDFKGKAVLDGGCGMGRNSYWVCTYGADRVVGFDFDKRSIAAAKRTLSECPNASVEFASMYDITYKDEFDIAFSVGVIHHLDHPERGLAKLFDAVKPGGKLVIWVYGYEHNEWVVKYINPIRWVTSRLPVWLTHIIAYGFAIPLYLFVRLFPVKREYFRLLRRFRFQHILLTVFDQLIPRVAHYWRKEEVVELVETLPANKTYQIHNVKGYSWNAIIEKT